MIEKTIYLIGDHYLKLSHLITIPIKIQSFSLSSNVYLSKSLAFNPLNSFNLTYRILININKTEMIEYNKELPS